jgi:hypothetical protein
MDDRFLDKGRQEPRPEFARSLRERLRRQDDAATQGHAARGFRFSPAIAAFATVLVIAGLFSIPAVRVSAQSFLDLFRVRNFAAVTIDAARLKQLREGKFDVESILGTPEMVRDPGPVRVFTNAEDALTSLAIDDVQVPPGVDGAEVRLHIRPVARTAYRRDGHEVMLIQAPSPELSLPAGIDVAQLGEIGLRIAGLPSGEARRFSQNVDWHSTLLVPVPSDASSFREVDVRGNKGLLVARGNHGTRRDGPRRRMDGGTQIFWSDGERVFAVVSRDVTDLELLQMANSVQ